ncbi:MAG: DUF4831 family protein [Bacteroidales bacterium]|nr:DUF4831 family protein [Bacteroidales bacterium]
MKKSILIFTALAAIGIASCTAPKKYIRVENINSVSTVKNNPIIYSLPKTAITVKVTAVNEVSVRGPYYQFASKYIGTEDIINSNSSVWKLGNIEISSYPMFDSSRTYVVDASYPCAMNFSPEGFLESVNTKPDFQERNYRDDNTHSNISSEDLSSRRKFQDMNVNRYETVFDTVLHVVDADSIFTAVPSAKKNLIRKSLDEQAQELANEIFLLRDDRNALLKGEGDGNNSPNGEALRYMVEQLNKLEESYMSMFVGKKIKSEKTYVFEYIPSKGVSQDVLFKFSPEYGIVPKESAKGSPVLVEINDLNDNVIIKNYDASQKNIRQRDGVAAKTNGFAYLTNAYALVKILQNNNSLSEKTLNINQLGTVKYLSSELMESDGFKMILYPQTGTLKSVN